MIDDSFLDKSKENDELEFNLTHNKICKLPSIIAYNGKIKNAFNYYKTITCIFPQHDLIIKVEKDTLLNIENITKEKNLLLIHKNKKEQIIISKYLHTTYEAIIKNDDFIIIEKQNGGYCTITFSLPQDIDIKIYS
jgi:hypothetical protein